MKNTGSLSEQTNKASLKQEIAKEKAEIVDSLGKLEMGLEEALAETRENIPRQALESNFDGSQRFQVHVPNPRPSSIQIVDDKSANFYNGRYNPTTNNQGETSNSTSQPIKTSLANATSYFQFPNADTNGIVANYNGGLRWPQEQAMPYLPNVNVIKPKINDEFQGLAPNPVANELASNANLQTQSLRFNQVATKPLNLNLGLNPVDNQQRNNTDLDESNPLTSQPPYNNDFNLPANMPFANQRLVNPYLNPGETIQSYVGRPPLTPPLAHAYPLSHEHEALLPPLNHQQLPPLNHNNLVAAAETTRYTGSDANAFSSQGKMHLFQLILLNLVDNLSVCRK